MTALRDLAAALPAAAADLTDQAVLSYAAAFRVADAAHERGDEPPKGTWDRNLDLTNALVEVVRLAHALRVALTADPTTYLDLRSCGAFRELCDWADAIAARPGMADDFDPWAGDPDHRPDAV